MLTEAQIRQFHDEGYLFLPETFSPEEIAILKSEAEAIYRQQRPEVWREKSGAPRTAFAAHLYNEAFALLARHPRMIRPVEQLFGEQVYMHQYKINAKASFTGDVWQWHQDYGTWARDDGMPEPRAMNIAVFLDEVMPINGPLMLVPRSHTDGVFRAGTRHHHDVLSALDPGRGDRDGAGRAGRDRRADRQTGRAAAVPRQPGARLGGNITPYPRKIVYLTLNAVSNYIRTPTRAEWIAHTDFTPIVPTDEGALTRYAQSFRQAAE